MQNFGRSAAFLSAGGYHHHIGLNTWAGVGAPQPAPDSAGLRFFTILLPDQTELDRLADRLQAGQAGFRYAGSVLDTADPSGNRILVMVGEPLPQPEAGPQR